MNERRVYGAHRLRFNPSTVNSSFCFVESSSHFLNMIPGVLPAFGIMEWMT